MKKLVFIVFFMSFSLLSFAQESPSKNEKNSIEVLGNCDMCKKRIEKAAFSVKGVGLPNGAVIPDRFPAGSVDNYLAENKSSFTNISVGAWTAPRSHFTAGAEQSFLDEVAELAGKDPIDFRLELFDRALKNPVGDEYDYDAERYAGVLKLVKEKSNWDNDASSSKKGVAAYFCHDSYVAVVMEVVLKNNEPKIKKFGVRWIAGL